MANTRIVLVRPEHAVNIGAVARIAANTGMAGLDLVAPSEWRTVECWRTAWGATDVLDRASVHETVRAALADSGYVVAVSRRTADGVTHSLVEPDASPGFGFDSRLTASSFEAEEPALLWRGEIQAQCADRLRRGRLRRRRGSGIAQKDLLPRS